MSTVTEQQTPSEERKTQLKLLNKNLRTTPQYIILTCLNKAMTDECFQFSVRNFVNMHQTPTCNLYINGKLMKLSK